MQLLSHQAIHQQVSSKTCIHLIIEHNMVAICASTPLGYTVVQSLTHRSCQSISHLESTMVMLTYVYLHQHQDQQEENFTCITATITKETLLVVYHQSSRVVLLHITKKLGQIMIKVLILHRTRNSYARLMLIFIMVVVDQVVRQHSTRYIIQGRLPAIQSCQEH